MEHLIKQKKDVKLRACFLSLKPQDLFCAEQNRLLTFPALLANSVSCTFPWVPPPPGTMTISCICAPPASHTPYPDPAPAAWFPQGPACSQDSQPLLLFPPSWVTLLSCCKSSLLTEDSSDLTSRTSPAHADSFSLPSYCARSHTLTERLMTFASFLVRNEKQGVIKPKIISYILFKMIRYTN